MAVTKVPENKPVVVGVDGTKMVLSPSESAQFNLLPGMDAGVLDEATGHKQNGLKAKTIRKGLRRKRLQIERLVEFFEFCSGRTAFGYFRTIEPCAGFHMR